MELDVTELNEKADWFNEVYVRLPADMRRGAWQMVVRAIDGGDYLVPIPIRISAK